MGRTVADTIAEAAMREGMNRKAVEIGKAVSNKHERIGIVGTSQNIFTPGKVYVYIVAIDDEPITLEQFNGLKTNMRATRGQYTIQYIPKGFPKRNPKFPYLIGQDLVRIRVTVSGPAHWVKMCERIPELDWIRRNTTFSNDMFAIAKKHPGLVLRFGIDFVKYCNKIEKRAEELGIDIDHKPLVTYQWGKNDVPQVDGVMNPVKTKRDYAKELAEASETVRSEEDVL